MKIFLLTLMTIVFSTTVNAEETVNVCDRGSIGKSIVTYTKAASCDTVSKQRMSSIRKLSIAFSEEIKLNAFDGLTSLNELVIYGRAITNIPDFVFQNLTNLRSLIIKSSYLETINEKTFSGLKYLNELEITNTKLITIDPNTFQELERLKTLNLSHNQIAILHDDTFKNLKLLEDLDLSYNHLGTISPALLQNSTLLQTADLRHNNELSIDSTTFNCGTIYSECLLALEDSQVLKVDEKIYLTVIKNIKDVFEPIFKRRGEEIVLVNEWANNSHNAVIYKNKNILSISVFGASARLKTTNEDSLTRFFCYLIGHHIGGSSKITNPENVNDGANSHYFATIKCMKRVLTPQNNIEKAASIRISADVNRKCERDYEDLNEIAMCKRIEMSEGGLAKIIKAMLPL